MTCLIFYAQVVDNKSPKQPRYMAKLHKAPNLLITAHSSLENNSSIFEETMYDMRR
jgi:hypothetical protein